MNPSPTPPGLSRQQRSAVLLLAAFLILGLVFWRLLPSFQTSAPSLAEEEELNRSWEAFVAEHLDTLSAGSVSSAYREKTPDRSDQAAAMPLNMAPFDPNTASEQQLLALGLPLRTVRTLIKYRNKGGRFYKPDDLRKLYTLSADDLERILPYAYISDPKKNTGKQDKALGQAFREAETVPDLKPVDLNKADAETLMRLRGIGPAYSRRIIEFREQSGGFFTVAQLQDVYGFPDSTYQQLKDQFVAEPADVKKIPINQATEDELARHPYIGKKLAFNIIRLRNDLKSFTQVEQLKQTPLINEEKYRKIAPYLRL